MKFDDFIQCCVTLKSLTDAFRAHDHNQSGSITINYEQFLEMVLAHTLTGLWELMMQKYNTEWQDSSFWPPMKIFVRIAFNLGQTLAWTWIYRLWSFNWILVKDILKPKGFPSFPLLTWGQMNFTRGKCRGVERGLFLACFLFCHCNISLNKNPQTFCFWFGSFRGKATWWKKWMACLPF